ncbi:hypothetical protein G7Y89_g7184 [Cudoniella acicularis]|uniref:Uncharacterized protein n=1 Tax=Cudoniella acicularis TaxID=354080 RepID=A0A8H4W2B9_9HELO|nr:hypothetical protein G7Y89_g7184 [Cudoniella acicularis]
MGSEYYSKSGSSSQKHRVPDNDKKYIKSTPSKSGRVVVEDQRKSIYDPDAPRSSDAKSSHYKESSRRSKH